MVQIPYPPTLAPQAPSRKPKTVPPPPFEADHQAPGPVRLEHGACGAVTLSVLQGDTDDDNEHDKKRQLRLQTVARRGTDAVKLQEVVAPALVFPATKRRSHATPQSTIEQIVEANKRYLTTLPEVAHVPYDLVHELVSEAHAETNSGSVASWDPYIGNCIATTSAQNIYYPQSAAVGLVAFPSGQVGQELNVSSLTVKVSRRIPPKEKFTPATRPVASFLTPIQQIVTSPFQTINHDYFRKPHLAVRTHSHVHLIDLNLRTRTQDNGEPVIARELLAISREMTGGARHMDVAMSPWERTRGVGISDDGSIWEFGMQSRSGVVYPQSKGRASVVWQGDEDRSFHRIGYGSMTYEVNVLTDQTARLLDLRSPNDSLSLLDLRGSTSYLTSLERKSTDARFSSNLLCVSTTESVSWLDKRMPGKAVVSWDHHRAFDRTLELVSTNDDDLWTVLLTSRQNNVVTAFTTPLNSVELLHDPYLITPPTAAEPPMDPTRSRGFAKSEDVPLARPIFDVRRGSAFLRHPTLPSDYKDVLLFELSARGAVVARRLRMGSEAEVELVDPFVATPRIFNDWTEEVKRLALAGEADEEVKEAEKRDGKLVQLDATYQEARSLETLSSSSKKSLIDRYLAAVDYLREVDAPHENMMTAHDIAHYATSTSKSPFRSLFLSDSGLHPQPGSERAVFDLLGRAGIGQGAASSHSVARRIEDLVGSPLAAEPGKLPKELWTAYGMPSLFKPDSDESAPAAAREARARARLAAHVLALDLALAAGVFASDAVRPPAELDPDGALERATQALSLYGDDGTRKAALPPLHFGFIRPVLQGSDLKGKARADAVDHDAADGPGVGRTVKGGNTTRSLMASWLVGEDPLEHRHVDLHGEDHHSRGAGRTPGRLAGTSAAAAASFTASQQHSQGAAGAGAGSAQASAFLPPPPAFSQTGRRLQPPTLATTSAPTTAPYDADDEDGGDFGRRGGAAASLPPLRPHATLPSPFRPGARHALSSQPPPSSQGADAGGPQTQILPGAFGGRGGAGKAKKKKRVGGF